jgi:subtilisin-like proprotein convertase family protein
VPSTPAPPPTPTSPPATTTQTFTATDVGQPILDFIPVTSTLAITKDITISDLNVTVNATHSYVGDMRLTLIAPDGTRVVLFNRRGGNGDNLANTVFDDEGNNSIYAGTAPFAGSYKPEYVLKSFDGKNAKGTWQLVVEDTSLFDGGKLNAWSLTIEGTTKAASMIATPPAAQAPAAPPVNRKGQLLIGLESYFVRV